MNKNVFLIFAWFIACFGSKADIKKPNLILFLVDDMGWGSIGPNGQAERRAKGLPTVKTPNLDKLAAEGVNFTRSYGCTVCSPSRSSQQTGFHQGHTFADRNDPNNAKKAMRADDLTMGEMLSNAGYTTGYWGKWGYGGSKSQEDPTIDNLQTLPTSHGYQQVVAELHHVRAHTFFQPTLWNAPAKAGAVGGLELRPNSLSRYQGDKKYPNTPALQNHPDYPATAYCDDVYAFAALDFVRAGAKKYKAIRRRRHARHQLGEMHAGQLGSDTGEFTPQLRRRFRLGIDHIHLRRAAIKMDVDHRLGRGALAAFRTKQIRQREATDAQRARAQKTAAR